MRTRCAPVCSAAAAAGRAHISAPQRTHPGGMFHTALQRRARRSGRGARYAAIFLSSSHSDLAGSHAADGRRRVHHTPPPALTNRERKRLSGAECLIAELPAAGRWPYGNERCGGDIATVPLHSRARPAARPRLGSFEASAATGRSCCDSGCRRWMSSCVIRPCWEPPSCKLRSVRWSLARRPSNPRRTNATGHT
jgi:hypothetical protein